MTRRAVLEKMARAICPKVKPWLDAAHIKQSGICDCPGRYTDPQHGELITACFAECEDIAEAALAATPLAEVAEAGFAAGESAVLMGGSVSADTDAIVAAVFG